MIKNILFALLVSTVFVACKSSSNIVTSKKEAIEKGIYDYDTKDGKVTSSKKSKRNNTSKSKTSYSNLNDKIVTEALDYVGVSYRTGGTTKSGMDCSGLVFKTFGDFDISLPRTSIDMSRHGKKISKNEAIPGDLIFFKTNGRSVINHVGIITEIDNDEITFVHASTSKGVIVSSTADNYYGTTFAQINRVIN